MNSLWQEPPVPASQDVQSHVWAIYEERIVKAGWMQGIGSAGVVEVLLAVGLGRCVPFARRGLAANRWRIL